MENKSFNIPSRLETLHLILRPYQKGDGRFFFKMVENNNREHLREILGYITETNDIDKIENWIIDLASDWESGNRFVLSFWEKNNEDYLGHIWIEPVDWKIPIFELGWFIDKNQQGQGYVTEAVKKSLEFVFKYLQAHKAVVRVREYGPYTIKSKNVAERCGFVKEGFLRDTIKLENGSFIGENYYGLLKEDYDKLY